VRKTLNIKKVGHSGTLDPFASGLLVIAVGEATKILSELILAEKEYVADIYFGATSTTDDPEGEITEMKNVAKISKNDLQKVLVEFTGKITQVPPAYSALKIKGKRACDRVRAGEDMAKEMEKKKREVEIFSLGILKFKFPHVKLKVHSGSGTYIRSLARGLGERMECGGYLEELKRTKIGDLRIEDAVELEKISEKNILPLRPEFFSFLNVEISEEEEKEVRFGGSFILNQDTSEVFKTSEVYQKVSLFRAGRMVGFGEVLEEKGIVVVQPRKILNQ